MKTLVKVNGGWNLKSSYDHTKSTLYLTFRKCQLKWIIIKDPRISY